MIDHVWSVLCETALIDQDSKLISLINILEQITIPEEPGPDKALPIVVNLVSTWVRSDLSVPGKGQSRINFVSPSGNTLQSLLNDVDLTNYERLRAKGQFRGLKLPEEGQYHFNVEFREDDQHDWSKVASVPFKVNFKPEN
jgi:hypothetical protein